MPSLNTQSCIRRPLSSTLKFKDFCSPKKPNLSPKNFKRKKISDTIVFSRKIFSFAPENMLLIIGSQFLFSVLARLPKRPKILYQQTPLNPGLGI